MLTQARWRGPYPGLQLAELPGETDHPHRAAAGQGHIFEHLEAVDLLGLQQMIVIEVRKGIAAEFANQLNEFV